MYFAIGSTLSHSLVDHQNSGRFYSFIILGFRTSKIKNWILVGSFCYPSIHLSRSFILRSHGGMTLKLYSVLWSLKTEKSRFKVGAIGTSIYAPIFCISYEISYVIKMYSVLTSCCP